MPVTARVSLPILSVPGRNRSGSGRSGHGFGGSRAAGGHPGGLLRPDGGRVAVVRWAWRPTGGAVADGRRSG
ncbi:hypothetical protein SCATT_01070 [Streptantibioticus cattleyicolor NRRL 8057 = DSM 46488]|uniref:Uncharacterized protein n=1 Tax=Streptantibioticus cattleyicolor (strain ATCC 35852 / DSM 46488 / JCM 4925 / NBRC 14057 / NRRL 8057) TaxID=1003195 RepID=G8WYT7_STREN|nr:hypothetical protein SCATT_01070 [Streptantibioticus cattleyicolor NRRL 8057 = DSM 46488]